MRKRLAALVAAFAALALVAANEPTQAVGTAQTSLTAAELSVTGVSSPVDALTLLDVRTFASTDTDTAKNALGAPFSEAIISPLKVSGEDVVDPVRVRSDGDTSESTATLNENVGLAGIALNPLGMTANATADTAMATVSAATAEVTALSEALGITLNHVPGVASVDADGATATSGIGVSGVELSLGELLPVDLADLPLDTLLDLGNLLEDQLSVAGDLDLSTLTGATEALETALEDLTGLLGEYDGAVGDLNDVVAQINAAAGDLIEVTDATQLASDVQTAHDIQSTIDGLDTSGLTDSEMLSLINVVNGLVEDHNALANTYSGAGVSPLSTLETGATTIANLLLDPTALLDLLNTLDANAGTLEGYIQGGLDAVTTIATLGAADGPLASAIGAVEDAVAAIASFLETTDLEQLITDLVGVLQGLIGLVPDLISDLDVSSLLDIDPIGVTVNALATSDSATPSITCGGGGVAVAGIQVVDDVDGCSAVSGVGDTLNGALGTVGDVLATLTTVEVPTPTLELFTERRESSGQEGAYRTATAGITALILDLPSVDLDAVVEGALDGALSDILGADLFGLLQQLADELTTAVATVDEDAADLIDGAVSGALGDLETTVSETTVDTSGIEDAEAALDGLLADLADRIAGAVPDSGLTTPGVNLKVDPVSTVEFAAAAAGAPAPPTGEQPEPAPQPAPSLPATGGGLALLGMLALAGGVALRRRS